MTDRASSEAVALEVNGWRILFRVRTLAYLLAALGVGGGAATAAKMVGVATTADMQALRGDVREASSKAAAIEPIVAEHGRAIDAIVVKINSIQVVQQEDAAERIADRVAEPVRDARRSRETWRATRERVLANLRAGRPARDGLDVP